MDTPNSSRAIIAHSQSSGHRDLLYLRVAELTLAKHSIRDIHRILQAEGIRAQVNGVMRIQQELREQWRTSAAIATDSLVAEELATIDQLQKVLWPQSLAGDLPTIDRLMKLLEHRAKLLGIYAPAQTRISGIVTHIKSYQNLNIDQV